MAEQLYYIGTTGPFYMDDTDPLAQNPGQVVTFRDIQEYNTYPDIAGSGRIFIISGVKIETGVDEDGNAVEYIMPVFKELIAL